MKQSITDFPIEQQGGFKYIDLGPKEGIPLVLLHGLFGTASNFDALIRYFQQSRRVLMPILPIFEMSIRRLSLKGLEDYVAAFMDEMSLERFDLLGNSLGGHLAILYTLDYPGQVRSLTLTGSSGLYESAFGTSFPKREDYEYIKNKVKLTFYDPEITTKDMVDEVFDIVNDRGKAIRIIKTAKSAIRHNVGERLHLISVPTLLIWGRQDSITPPFVAEKFDELITDTRLHILDRCGHAPMLELPKQFNALLEGFLTSLEADHVARSLDQ